MARINLLPWREQLRRERQQQFIRSSLATAIMGAVLVFLVGLVFDQRISHQEERNGILQTEIAKLEIKIRRIEQLEQTRNRLISRKRIIEELQASRSMTVELMDKLAKTIPVGITLSSVRQQGTAVTMLGTSQSNARVSAYLQSLDRSDMFNNAQLGYVRAAETPATRAEPYEFSIAVNLRTEADADAEAGYDREEVTDVR